MRIYHVEFAKTGLSVSGGEVWMVEVIKQLQARGIVNILLTTDNAKRTYERLGLIESDTLKYEIIESYEHEKKLPLLLSYIVRTFQARQLVKRVDGTKADAIFCHSDFFPNSIPFYALAKRLTTKKLFCLFHMLAPSPAKGYEGHFTNKLQVPRLNILHYQLNQWIYYRIIGKTKAAIITSNNYYAQLLGEKCPGSEIHVLKRFAGAEEYSHPLPKKYDILWMGRFHPQKGLLEVPSILEKIKAAIPNVKMLILGDGVNHLREQFNEEIAKRGLSDNVEMKGFVLGEAKYRYISQSKVFLMTSFYESFGMVNLEALRNGVPVVAYDLPVYSAFTKGMVKVKLLDKQSMAEEVVHLLKQPKAYGRLSQDASDFSKSFTWRATANEIYQLL